jgi:hypothetical protein
MYIDKIGGLMRKTIRNRNNTRNRIMIALIVVLAISIAYAAISTTLKINGSALFKKQTWSVYWANPQVTTGSATSTPPTVSEDEGDPSNTKATWNTTLTNPGDFYEFTIDAINEGTIDAMIDGTSFDLPNNLPDYIDYTITYDDGQDIEEGHVLPKADDSTTPPTPTVETYKIRVEYDPSKATEETIANIPAEGVTYTFTAGVDYSQADSSAQPRANTRLLYGFYSIMNSSYYSSEDVAAYAYDVEVGDTLPLEFGTAGSSVTSRYYGGVTTNYKKLRLAYNVYMADWDDYGTIQTDYYFRKSDCENSHSGSTCRIAGRLDYMPPIFYAYKINSQRTVQNRYICVYNNGKKSCFEQDPTSSDLNISHNVAAAQLGLLFGSYDSDAGTGCNALSSDSLDCYSADGYLHVYLYEENMSINYHNTNTHVLLYTDNSGDISGPYDDRYGDY